MHESKRITIEKLVTKIADAINDSPLELDECMDVLGKIIMDYAMTYEASMDRFIYQMQRIMDAQKKALDERSFH